MWRFEPYKSDDPRWIGSTKRQPDVGPCRVCLFCAFAICVPILLFTIPLYMRFLALRPRYIPLSPSDMKLLNYESTVSTFWCSNHTIKMNSTFNAYLLPKTPKVQQEKKRVTMKRSMTLEDDMKEYWGFYLLEGSSFKVRACSRHEGASLVVIKSGKNAGKCAWLGELESEEESDEINLSVEMVVKDEKKEREINATSSGEGMEVVDNDETELVDELLGLMEKKPRDKVTAEALNALIRLKDVRNQNVRKRNKLHEKLESDDENQASEVFDDDDKPLEKVQNFHQQGKYNFKDPNDGSNEEPNSSWSSSEEALLACEGVIFMIALDGGTKCHQNASEEDLASEMMEQTHLVTKTGFYYFIFSNENEITENFISSSFEMDKAAFNLNESQVSCINSTLCDLPLTFNSEEHVVLEVPQSTSSTCEYETEGLTSYHECNNVVRAESICQPRGAVYCVFFFLAPVIFLMASQI